jgi:hypothetical protein
MSDDRAIAVERMQHMVEAAEAIAAYVARGGESSRPTPPCVMRFFFASS